MSPFWKVTRWWKSKVMIMPKAVMIKDKAGKTSELQADGTFVEMALVPNSQIVADFVALDEQKRIIIEQR